jgi:hypothetical protein
MGIKFFKPVSSGCRRRRAPSSPLVLREALKASVAALRSYAVIASMRALTPTMLSMRVRCASFLFEGMFRGRYSYISLR